MTLLAINIHCRAFSEIHEEVAVNEAELIRGMVPLCKNFETDLTRLDATKRRIRRRLELRMTSGNYTLQLLEEKMESIMLVKRQKRVYRAAGCMCTRGKLQKNPRYVAENKIHTMSLDS